MPITITEKVVAVSKPSGLLRRNGTLRVRIAKTISVWMASDSTNQPVRNSAGPACRTPSINPNVRKSNSDLTKRNVSMKRRIYAMFQCEGRQRLRRLPRRPQPPGAGLLCATTTVTDGVDLMESSPVALQEA